MNNKQHPPRPMAEAPSVRFSDFSSMMIYNGTGSRKSMFYSSEEMRRFRNDMLQARARLATLIAGRQRLNADDLYDCIGIEVMITPGMAMRAVEHKQNHARLILTNQGTCTAEELRDMSKESSSQAREEAQKLASSYLNKFVV